MNNDSRIVRMFVDYDELLDNIYDYLFDHKIYCNINFKDSSIVFKTNNAKSYIALSSDSLYRYLCRLLGNECIQSMGTGQISYLVDDEKIFLYTSPETKNYKLSKNDLDIRGYIISVLSRAGFDISNSDIIAEKVHCVGKGNSDTYMFGLLMCEDCVSDVHNILVEKFSDWNNVLLNSRAVAGRINGLNVFKERLVLFNG